MPLDEEPGVTKNSNNQKFAVPNFFYGSSFGSFNFQDKNLQRI